MVELVEYLLAFGISAALAGASVFLLQGAVPGIRQVATQSEADQIASSAREAILSGGAVQLVLPLRSTSLTCGGGHLTLSIDGSAFDYSLVFPCSFNLPDLNGACTLTFSSDSDLLTATASCY